MPGRPPDQSARPVVIWLVLSVVGVLAIVLLLGPHMPPGRGSAEASEQTTTNIVIAVDHAAHRARALDLLRLALRDVPPARRGDRGRAADRPATRAAAGELGRRHDAHRAVPRHLRHATRCSIPRTARAAAARARTRSSTPGGKRAPGAGHRAAVGVDVPLPDVRRVRDDSARAARSASSSSSTSPRSTSIHSFWAYELGVKADAVPGADNVAYVTANQARDVLDPLRRGVRPVARLHEHARRGRQRDGVRRLAAERAGSDAIWPRAGCRPTRTCTSPTRRGVPDDRRRHHDRSGCRSGRRRRAERQHTATGWRG